MPDGIAQTDGLKFSATQKKTKVRWIILGILFMVTAVNYADRATIAIAGPVISKDLGLNAAQMGWIFSAFGWAYVVAQLPGGWLLDRYGSKMVYAGSLALWSLFTMAQGLVGFITGGLAVLTLFALRFALGVAESPSFPGNGRVVAAWFPKQERATASAIFNSAQYFATVLFAPLMGWITTFFGWPWVFGMMGGLGILLTITWLKLVYSPIDHPMINRAELDYIAAGGGLVNMDQPATQKASGGAKWRDIGQLFSNRMMVGIFIGQYCINAITYFFITWFPIYLVQARGMTILNAGFATVAPAIFGFLGGISGGIISDWLIKQGWSVSWARKTPYILGMLAAATLVLAAISDSNVAIVALMSFAFYGKGVAAGAGTWAVVSDTAPKEAIGLAGSIFNCVGNVAGIVTPIVFGYIVAATGGYGAGLFFVGAHCIVAAFLFLFVMGKIERVGGGV